jgi:hypothetical protein
MPNLWDKFPEAPPPSEVNPLTNPLLERNLGRWAKVYFSNPPEKRDQAVADLLEQIKLENGAGPAAGMARHNFDRETKIQRPVCPACQHQNPPGHKFCSRCGKVLELAAPAPAENVTAPPAPEAPPPPSEDDAQWLREQAFSGMDRYYGRPRRGWKYLAGALAVGLAILAYLQWAPGPRTRVASTIPAPPANVAAAALPSENSPSAETMPPAKVLPPESSGPEAHNAPASAAANHRTTVPAGVQLAVQKSQLLDAAPLRQTATAPEGGIPDLRLAQRYLGGSMGVRDSAEAAKLLWKSVRQQNATAAVLLSDLYLRGDGVPRSCDQARLLLVAAAKRGSPLAAQQLRNLESQGCR